MKSLHGHSHLCVVVQDAARYGQLIHAILVEGEPVWPLVRYFQARSLDLSTESAYAYAMGLLIDFIAAKAGEYADMSHRAELFPAFAHAVLYGTVKDGEDPSGLWWQPRSTARARKLTRIVCEVSDWLQDNYQTTAINPFSRTASTGEQIAYWRRWSVQKSSSLLGHLKSRKDARHTTAGRVRDVMLPGTEPLVLAATPAFPEEHIDRMLFEGFVLAGGRRHTDPWRRWNIRDIMITMLLHYGGLRVSEPFHIWVDDVFVDPANPERAVVLVHHPHDGLHIYPDPVTGQPVKSNRIAVLRTLYNRQPLTELTGKKHSGWKDALLTNQERKAFEVFWFPQAAGELFLTLFRMYLKHVRPATSRHPYLFVTDDGEPFGAGGFIKNHERAVKRIGLEPSKHGGTSCHGHRHAYGKRLRQAGVKAKVIQVAMHHRSHLSQEVYTAADTNEAMHALEAAAPLLPSGNLNLSLPPLAKGKP